MSALEDRRRGSGTLGHERGGCWDKHHERLHGEVVGGCSVLQWSQRL